MIRKNEYDEYEVPTGTDSAGRVCVYYTTDKEDAIDTLALFNPHAKPTIRKGSYAK